VDHFLARDLFARPVAGSLDHALAKVTIWRGAAMRAVAQT